ncbi:unnamed protein product, partial [Fusarium graminearum]
MTVGLRLRSRRNLHTCTDALH